jgi:TatD DNase family protein
VSGAPVQPPAPLPAPVVDSHTHLDVARSDDEPAAPLDQALERAAAVNVTEVVQVGCDLDAAARAVAWSRRYRQVHAAVALHPTQAAALAASGGLSDALERIATLARDPSVVAVGETGLDHYWTTDAAGRAAQQHSFREHIRLARDTDRALVIHDRDAHTDVLDVLDSEGPPDRVVFHCFSGDAAMARRCVRAGWFVSFAGPLTFRNASDLRAAAAAALDEGGLAQVLVETDAPYLTPHPYRGRVNSSYLLPWTVRALAEVASVPLAQVCEATRSATIRALDLPVT